MIVFTIMDLITPELPCNMQRLVNLPVSLLCGVYHTFFQQVIQRNMEMTPRNDCQSCFSPCANHGV